MTFVSVGACLLENAVRQCDLRWCEEEDTIVLSAHLNAVTINLDDIVDCRLVIDAIATPNRIALVVGHC